MPSRPQIILAGLCLLGIVCGTGREASAAPGDTWRERTQVVWDRRTRSLVRQVFQVWDPHPERNLDFLWEPSGAVPAGTGVVRAEGPGTLSWHVRNAPTYDRRYTDSVFKGTLKDGKPDGDGYLATRAGLSYKGTWSAGLMHGSGRLRLENGDRYDGEFHDGLMDGQGIYVAADGTVYRGTFAKGMRSGVARLSDLAGSYVTVWQEGREIERRPDSAAEKPLRPVPAAAAAGAKVTLTLDRGKIQEFHEANPDVGEAYPYELEARPGAVDIRLSSKEILAFWKGEAGVMSPSSAVGQILNPGQFAPVFLSGLIENQGTTPLQIVEAYLEVSVSRKDQTPLLDLRPTENDSCTSSLQYNPGLTFRNLGWGSIKDARITYTVGSKTERSTPSTATLGSFGYSRSTSVEEKLRQLGFDIKALQASTRADGSGAQECSRSEDASDGGSGSDTAADTPKPDPQFEACARTAMQKNFGPLARYVFHPDLDVNVYTTVAGRIDYASTGIDGKDLTRSSTFSMDVPLLSLSFQGMAEMGCPDFTPQRIRSVSLSEDRRQYRVPLPAEWKGRLDPGKSRTVGVTLTAPKSSEHRFRLVLKTKDGTEAVAPDVSLSYFRPRMRR